MNNLSLRKPKIIHVVTSLGTGGMENGIVNLCNRHDRNKFELTVCCLKSEGEMTKRLREDIKIICMKLPEGKPILQPISIARLFKRLRPDIVHTHGLAGGSYVGIVGAKLAGVPVIINGEHGAFYLKPHQLILQKMLAAISSITLSVSESLKKQIIQNLGLAGDKILVIPNGVDTKIFSGNYDSSTIQKDLRSEHGIVIDKESVVVSCVGSLKPEKNQMMLLKALKEIKKQIPDINLRVLFVGDGIDRAALKQFVTVNGLQDIVAFLGKRNDVPHLLSITDIVISTSISCHEGMSNVVLEAFSSGLPVISTKSVGTDELIREGWNGFLIDQYDVAGLVQKIELLAIDSNLRKSMGGNARSLANDGYSIDKMVSDYEKLYLNCISGSAT
jgi:sugar transferase (PEP-CTERM/EpsH1 system associated)